MTLVGKDQFAEIAPTAAVALKSAGDEEQARHLLALAETEASRPRRVNGDSQVRLARIYAVQGKTDQAIGLLSSAIRSGWLPPYLPFHTDLALDPPLAELKSDPRFGRLRQEILGHLKKERAELGPLSLD